MLENLPSTAKLCFSLHSWALGSAIEHWNHILEMKLSANDRTFQFRGSLDSVYDKLVLWCYKTLSLGNESIDTVLDCAYAKSDPVWAPRKMVDDEYSCTGVSNSHLNHCKEQSTLARLNLKQSSPWIWMHTVQTSGHGLHIRQPGKRPSSS